MQIVAMESRVLKVLNFRIRCITPKTFMGRYLRAAGAVENDILTNLVKYLTELSIPEYRFLKYRPSELAAAAVLCARRTLNFDEVWTHDLEHYTGYTAPELAECAEDIAQAHRDAPTNTLQAIREKYSHSPYQRVAINPRVQPLLRGTFLYNYRPAPSAASAAEGVTSNQFN